MPQTQRDRIAELEDILKDRDRRISELKTDLDNANNLVDRMREQVQDCADQIDRWIEAFKMELDDDGVWKWDSSFVRGDEWFERCLAITKEWNKIAPYYNAVVAPRRRNVGRPLAASDTQRDTVLKLREQGMSLRVIAEETSLGLPTVRTIVDQRDSKDRTTRKHMERIRPDRAAEREWQSRSRTRKALPRSINALKRQAAELVKEAKGLK